MSPILAGRGRKITVNERIERILQGSLTADTEELHGASTQRERQDQINRMYEMSRLYSSSVEDKFLKSRKRDTGKKKRSHARQDGEDSGAGVVTEDNRSSPSKDGAKRTLSLAPLNLEEDDRANTSPGRRLEPSPIKPSRCLSKYILQQREREELLHGSGEASPSSPPPFQPKPWYKGYSSDHKAPPCSMDAKIRRYGAYGAIKMVAAETVAGTAPYFGLNESQSLPNLELKNAPNPFAPKLHGSPTLWPEDASYPSGAQLEINRMTRCPSPDCRYSTHSVGHVSPDAHLQRTKAVHLQDTRALEQAFEEQKEKRRQEIAYNKQQFKDWKAGLKFESLADKMDHPFVKLNARRAKAVTIVRTTEYSPISKFNEQVEQLTAKRFTLRWRHMAILMEVMRRTPCRRPVLQDIEKILARCYDMTVKNKYPFELTRQQFWELIQKEYPMMEVRHANRLYSSYDYMMQDRLDARAFLGTVRALRVQQGTPIDIICMSLRDFDTMKNGRLQSRDSLCTTLTMCCGSEEEQQDMEKKSTMMWELLLREPPGDASELSGSPQRPTTSGSRPVTSHVLEDDLDGIPIEHVRAKLEQEKHVLKAFTDMLLRRREECFSAASIPLSRGT
ncbi:TPA: hypothetical protein N0F65_000143 [Lagenidium giganteum]|uniref:Uncharacterized protein n=1 Tax=Lagenidium giganteum TaxID=4803 RepID=A0AAV2YFH4_9STRA|nr:TPA: hypothetical protein N0F65_000143 [Lagenidium giganteum]